MTREVDRMDLMGHWQRPECPNGHPPPMIDRGRGYRCEHCGEPPMWVQYVSMPEANWRGAVAALETLMAFGRRLMESEDEDERGIGWCICEGARIVEEPPLGGQ